MLYTIPATLIFDDEKKRIHVIIIRGNNLHLFVSMPADQQEAVQPFLSTQMKIFYTLGEFHYTFQVEEGVWIADEELYQLVINQVNVYPNGRKEERQLVTWDALILDEKNMYYGTILDVSTHGVKLATHRPLGKKKIEVFYADHGGVSMKRKGKVVWSTTDHTQFYYGVQLK